VSRGVSLSIALLGLMCAVIVILLAIMKIFLSSQIYYESRKINELRQEATALQAEHNMLNSHIEALRFKNRITDPIFVMNQEE